MTGNGESAKCARESRADCNLGGDWPASRPGSEPLTDGKAY
jgi:hypothetical protein